nr:hypothetical protein [Tanacetum cinerariifolium]
MSPSPPRHLVTTITPPLSPRHYRTIISSQPPPTSSPLQPPTAADASPPLPSRQPPTCNTTAISEPPLHHLYFSIIGWGCPPLNHHRGGGPKTVQPPQPHVVVSDCDGATPSEASGWSAV